MRKRKCDKERRGIEKMGKEKRKTCHSSEEKYLICIEGALEWITRKENEAERE